MKRYTDLQMLSCLLRLPGPVLKQRKAFQAMFDDLTNGKIVNLSRNQRAWIEQVFYQHKLDRRELPPKPVRAPTRDKNAWQSNLLDFGPLPKRPPKPNNVTQ